MAEKEKAVLEDIESLMKELGLEREVVAIEKKGALNSCCNNGG